MEEIFRLLKDPDDERRYNDLAYAKITVDATVVIQAVGEVYCHLRSFSSVRDLVGLHVDRIVAWIRHLYWMKIRNFSDPIHRDENGIQALISALAGAFITIYGLQPRTSMENVRHHPQITSNADVICGLWLLEDPQNIRPSASTLFVLIIPGMEEQINDALVRSAYGDVDRVASVAMTKLRQAMKTTPLVGAKLALYLSVTTMLAFGNQSVSRSLHDHPIYPTFAKCIRILANSPASDAASKYSCARYLIIFDRLVLGDAHDLTRALRQSIRFGLLDSLAQLRAIHGEGVLAMNEEVIQSIRNILNLISGSLKAGPICTETVKALKDLRQHAFRVDTNNSPEWNIWNQLMVSVMAHSFFMRTSLLILAADIQGREICSNCGMQYSRSSLRKCAGCLVTRYCSKECQAEDWKSNHRNVCTFRRGRNERQARSRVIGHSRIDGIYAILIAKYDIRRHRAHLKILAAKKHPNVPFNLIGFIVDYSCGFPTFDTFLSQNSNMDANNPTVVADTDVMKHKSDAEAHSNIVLVNYPYIIGREIRQTYFFDLHVDGGTWEAPRLRADITIGQSEKRPSGRFKDGDIPLDASFDEVDEIARRMALCPNLMREPYVLLDQVPDGLEEDWPFDYPFDFSYAMTDYL